MMRLEPSVRFSVKANQAQTVPNQKLGAPQCFSPALARSTDSTHIRFAGTPKEDMLTRQFEEALESGLRENALQIANDPDFKVSLDDTFGNPLRRAIGEKDEALVDVLLSKLEESPSKRGTTALLEEAFQVKAWGIAEKLIEKGMDFREVQYYVPMAFQFPDTPEWADYLISKGLNLRGSLNGTIREVQHDSREYEVGVFAAATGRTQLLEKAFEAGFDPNTTFKSNYSNSPDTRLLDVAVARPAVLKRLLEKGVGLRHPQHGQFPHHDKNILEVIGRNALPESFDVIMPALQASNEFTPAEKKKMIDSAFSTALYNADSHLSNGSLENRVAIVKRFLDAGCGRDASGTLDPKLMRHTVGNGVLLDTLIEAGIDVDGRFWEKEQTALMTIASQVTGGDVTIGELEKLIGLGANVHARDTRGWTALMYAMDTSRVSLRQNFKREYIPKVADFLKSKGATLSFKDKAKLKLEVVKPTRIISRALDNIFGGIHW